MAGVSLVTLPLAIFFPSLTAKVAVRQIAAGKWQSKRSYTSASQSDEEKLAEVYQTGLLIRAAILEGSAFFNLFGCLQTGHILNWALFGFFLIALLLSIPTYGSVASWIDSMRLRLHDERQLSGRSP
jgi:hypothetical protein